MWLKTVLFLMVLLLFVGGPDNESHRIYKYIWDSGHLFLFAGLTYYALKYVVKLDFDKVQALIIILILSLVVGLLIEIIQWFIGRSFEIKDIASDFSGTLIGVFIYSITNTYIWYKERKVLYAFIMILLAFNTHSLIEVLIDEIHMRQEFPNLAKLDSPYHLNRWNTNQASLSYSSKIHLTNEKSLMIKFLPGIYPSISLKHFIHDWSAHKNLTFNVFNENGSKLHVNLKIYDNKHIKSGYIYGDRFNKEIVLNVGWNEINIPINNILNAPQNRKMNINKINTLSIFLDNAVAPINLFIDDILLK